MNHWDQEGIPHKGWKCIEMIDLGEDVDDLGMVERETCTMCGQEGIRYVHVMTHQKCDFDMRVGCICAEKMEDDYIHPKERERTLINRHKRKMSFLKQNWTRNAKGNYVLRYKGKTITLMQSKFNVNEYGVYFNKQLIWKYKEKKIGGLENAKLVAFDLLDCTTT